MKWESTPGEFLECLGVFSLILLGFGVLRKEKESVKGETDYSVQALSIMISKQNHLLKREQSLDQN